MSSAPPDVESDHGQSPIGGTGIRWNWWNLLLFVPLVSLIVPLYNVEDPRLFGFPFFYWFQFLFIFVAVICTWTVYLKTRGRRAPSGARAASTSDDLGGSAARDLGEGDR